MGDDTQQTGFKSFGAQPAPDRGEKLRHRKGNNGPLEAPRSLPGDESSPSPGRHFVSWTWQRERISRLARICRCVERGRIKGKRLHKMFILHAWRWKGRHYTSDPARPIHFSYGRLMDCYYIWRNAGEEPAALALQVRCRNPRIGASGVVELSKLCLALGTQSFSAAYRKLKVPGGTQGAYRYATPAELRRDLSALLAHRRREAFLARVAERRLGVRPGAKARSRNSKIPASGVVEMAKLCLAPGILTFRAAYRKLGSPRATESAYRYATEAWVGRALAELLAHRCREPALARAAERCLRRLEG